MAAIEDFRFHDPRHSFVTNMRRAGKQDRVIMAITGHKTSTFMRYDTVIEEELKAAVMGDDLAHLGINLAHLGYEVEA